MSNKMAALEIFCKINKNPFLIAEKVKGAVSGLDNI